MTSIGSFICVRNGFHLDYCFELAAESLLKVCDQLVLCDSDSTDGTRQALERMADRDPRIKAVNWPWPSPKGESHHWFLRWLRFVQSQLTTDMVLYLDADEVLDDSPECHAAIREAAQERKCLAVDRLNYWRDARSLIPDGECCGKWCVRMGPREYPVVSDEPNHKGEQPMVDNAVREPRVKIHHLGFLREKRAFYRKARTILGAWFNRYDERLEKGENQDKPLWETECAFTDRLVPFTGYQPDAVQRWLADRGHFTERYVPMLPVAPDAVIEVEERRDAKEPVNVLHCGDFGDVMHLLPVCKALGSVNLFFADRNSICKRILERLHILLPLLESQPYIKLAKPHEGESIHWNSGDFRTCHRVDSSLAAAHWRHYQGQRHLPSIAPDFTAPWLTGIEPDERAKGRIVVARSPRYHNAYFRWKLLVGHYGDRMLFVGLPGEHAAFCREFGDVPHCSTGNLLEVARLIAGSDAFIGNQSAPLAAAEGLKHRRIVEVCPWQPDVVVSLDANAFFCVDGALNLPEMAGKPPFQCASGLCEISYLVNTSLTPKKGWGALFPEYPFMTSFRQLKAAMVRGEKMSQEDAHRRILDRLACVQPDYFASTSSVPVGDAFRRAVENARNAANRS